MLIYNTTYQVNKGDAPSFIIWIHNVYLPKVEESGMLNRPRLCRILSHHEEDSECYSLQFEVENSTVLHQWYQQTGVALNEELVRLFEDKAVGFSTLMEVIDEG